MEFDLTNDNDCQRDLAESYWKMAHAFEMTARPIYDKWLPMIEDPGTTFIAFTKKFWENDSEVKK